VGLYVLLVAPFFAWRMAYYGSLLPNTFYAKVGYTAAQLDRGWRYTVHSFAYSMTWALLLVAWLLGLVALVRPTRAPGVPVATDTSTRLLAGRPRDEALAVALVLATSYIVYVMLVGGDYEPTGRFHMPVLVPIYLLFQEALHTFYLLLSGPRLNGRLVAGVLAAAAGAACLWQSEQHTMLVLQERHWPNSRYEHHQQLRAVGEWLRSSTPPGAVVALSSIGALPYYSDRPIIDMMGLTDRHIGRRRMPDMGKGPAGHEKGDGAYVLQRRPDIILFDKAQVFPREMDAAAVLHEAHGVSELEIARSPEFARDYELRRAATPVGVVHYFARRRTAP
jgi:arabinofuranosyltransferase